MNQKRLQLALTFLRIVVALLMFVHGVARIYLGIVDDFGGFLTLQGFPLGFYLAWAITIFEIVGGIILASGYYVSILALIFAVHLLAGIFLVHLKDGWFVVGAGRNGVEYSVLLITVFLTVTIANFGKSG
ncbi:MAG: DoxX family protein, partial [Pyrinomonadaceae bacterium]